ncbi:uncharacterized protein EMH_0030980 [Eimeria mitis]|uniref:Uncharacterized protein n=1 Tax=Eimeria mitis TaxID=44415 RepID=U6JTJ0_9EIME|nr:uncharacterized protein EMH_0030980 [Eimeria mitis]CDJ27352.1 hypothetical protein EMH_0030980 [Eimeria mitis]
MLRMFLQVLKGEASEIVVVPLYKRTVDENFGRPTLKLREYAALAAQQLLIPTVHLVCMSAVLHTCFMLELFLGDVSMLLHDMTPYGSDASQWIATPPAFLPGDGRQC